MKRRKACQFESDLDYFLDIFSRKQNITLLDIDFYERLCMKVLSLFVLLVFMSGCGSSDEKSQRQRHKEETVSEIVPSSEYSETSFQYTSKSDNDVICFAGSIRVSSEAGDKIELNKNIVTITDSKKKVTFINAACYIVEQL